MRYLACAVRYHQFPVIGYNIVNGTLFDNTKLRQQTPYITLSISLCVDFRCVLHALGLGTFGAVHLLCSPASIRGLLACDVTDEASVSALVADVVSRAGKIDLLVNNAGVGMFGGAEESSIAQSQALFDVNFFGVMRMTNGAFT